MKRCFDCSSVHFSPAKSFLLLLSAALLLASCAAASHAEKSTTDAQEYIELKVYHATNAAQLAAIDQYLQASLLPLLTEAGFERVGVFKAIDNDTATDKRMYVLIPFPSLSQLNQLTAIATTSLGDSARAPDYTKAVYDRPPFSRMETILLWAFTGMPTVKASAVQGDVNDRVYELRSYESATEALHLNKVRMFNSGEVDLFQRLDFNAVFYGQVLAGSHMPSLMYMTTFANKALRDEHWKAFGNDPQWKQLSADPQYQNNVSHIDITFLRPTAYSKL